MLLLLQVLPFAALVDLGQGVVEVWRADGRRRAAGVIVFGDQGQLRQLDLGRLGVLALLKVLLDGGGRDDEERLWRLAKLDRLPEALSELLLLHFVLGHLLGDEDFEV